MVIAIIGTLVALLLPAVQSARETARGNTCRNNLKQLMTALTLMDTQQKKLPGYINEVSDPSSATGADMAHVSGRRASWVVMCFPYMEQHGGLGSLDARFHDDPHDNANARGLYPSIEYLTCPSDAPDTLTEPWLNYVGNAGQAMSDPDRADREQGERRRRRLLRQLAQHRRCLQATGTQDDREANPEIRTSMNYIQSGDGLSKTMLLSESVSTWFYAYDGDDSDAGIRARICDQQRRERFVTDQRRSAHLWLHLEDRAAGPFERINGDPNYDQNPAPTNMAAIRRAGDRPECRV